MSESLVPVVPSGTTHPPEADLPSQSAPPTSTDQKTDPERAAGPLSAQRVIPMRHPGRWITSAVALVLIAQIVHGLATNPFYQWDRFQYWFARPVITDGLVVTLEVTAYSAVLGLVGGVVLALARLSRSPVLRAISWLYVWLFRSVPLIVVLLFLYNFSALYRTLSLGVPFGPSFWRFDAPMILKI